MKKTTWFIRLSGVALVGTGLFLTGCLDPAPYELEPFVWPGHSMDPNLRPPLITPGTIPAVAPSDALVLFDGKDLAPWCSTDNMAPSSWKVENGYMQPTAKAGDIQTRQAFGSCQLHIEWATPVKVVGTGQGRGNSGVFLMGKYEIQVLDSYDNVTYADGQAGAIYGQKPPLVNACRQPGQWQTYDIIFHAPRFKKDCLVRPAFITVLHNGVLIQDHWEIKGSTFNKRHPVYEPHPDKLPLRLQDHNNPTRYSNIWIRELAD